MRNDGLLVQKTQSWLIFARSV